MDSDSDMKVSHIRDQSQYKSRAQLTVVEVGEFGGEGSAGATPAGREVHGQGLVGAQGGGGVHLSNL